MPLTAPKTPAKRERAAEALVAAEKEGEPISFPAVAVRAGVSVSLLYAERAHSHHATTRRNRRAAAPRASLVERAEPSRRAGQRKERARRLAKK